MGEAFGVAGHADDRVHRRLGARIRARCDMAVEGGPCALIIVQVAEEGEINAVLAEERLERLAKPVQSATRAHACAVTVLSLCRSHGARERGAELDGRMRSSMHA